MTAPAVSTRAPGFAERLRDRNAIWIREMRAAARVPSTPWVLLSLTLGLTLLMCSIGGIASNDGTPATIGQGLFQVFFSLAYLVVVIVGPAVAANGVAAEREGRTWEAVLLTGLSHHDVARGKFMAAFTTIALYIIVLAPVGALPFLFGGVTAAEVIIAFVVLFLIAALAVAFGLAVSSLMSSLRGAIVVTLLLAILVGPVLYLLFGFVAASSVHSLWNEIPDAHPIWLPLAYSRAKFGLDYVLLLIGLPIPLLLVPGWLLYEITVSNLSGDGDDRSTGLKRWFLLGAPLFAIACVAPIKVARWEETRRDLGFAGLSLFAAFWAFSALLFAAEPPGPSRRVRIHWERDLASWFTRFLGPGLAKTGVLLAVVGFACVWFVASAGMGLLALGSGAKASTRIEELLFFAIYASCFGLFVTGFTLWLRARGVSPWVTRLVAGGVIFIVSAGPWVVAAIGGALSGASDDDWLIVGAPSPFYAFHMMTWLDSTSHPHEQPVLESGTACALFWGATGIVLLAVAARRASRTLLERDASTAAAEGALLAEDATVAAASSAATVEAGPG